jgi:uncharacterized membrane protein YgdD (TMEM256/DUF423 family)
MGWPARKQVMPLALIFEMRFEANLHGTGYATTSDRPGMAMIDTTNRWRCVAGLFGTSGVILGALAAHAAVDPLATAAVERGSIYQLIHAVALLALAPVRGRVALLAKLALALGILLFSGSIALKHLAGVEALGFLTPIGGTCLILGWGLVVVHAALAKPPSDGRG